MKRTVGLHATLPKLRIGRRPSSRLRTDAQRAWAQIVGERASLFCPGVGASAIDSSRVPGARTLPGRAAAPSPVAVHASDTGSARDVAYAATPHLIGAPSIRRPACILGGRGSPASRVQASCGARRCRGIAVGLVPRRVMPGLRSSSAVSRSAPTPGRKWHPAAICRAGRRSRAARGASEDRRARPDSSEARSA